MADALQEITIFARVVSTGSLSAAARDLGLSPALVSRRLAGLEARLGVRLINRTTRSLHLTDEGAAYYETCTRVLAEIEEADAAVSAGRAEPRGILRVALPASFGNQHVAPLVPRFAARKLAPNRRVVCASPAYLQRHGAPRTPEDLAQHNCLTTTDFAMNWDYRGPDGKPGSARVTGRYACDNWEVLREWAVAGLGVALKSTWDVRRHLEDGSLVSLLPGYTFATDVAIYAVYPHRRHLPAKTRAFIEFLAESFGPEPYWDRPEDTRAPKPRIKARAAV